MRYLVTGIAFALFSVSLVWFSGAAHSADDLFGDGEDLFSEGEAQSDPSPDEDDPFGDFDDETDGEEHDDLFGDESARRGRRRRNDKVDSRQPAIGTEISKTITTGKKSDAEIAILAELKKTSPPIEFYDTSLTDVITVLRENHEDINFVLDEAALDIAGVDPETPISKTLNGVKLRSVLRLILKGIDLTYVIRDEVLLITTVEEAELWLAMEVYPVHDMLNKKDPNKSANALIDAITSNVAPESWEQVGGTGAVSFYQGSLIISQTLEVHQGVTTLLEKLREGIKIVGGPIYPETFMRGSNGRGNAGVGSPATVVANKEGGGRYGGGGGYGGEGGGYGGADEGGYGGAGAGGRKRSQKGY